MLPDLLHGDEKKVWGDAGYQGQTEAIRKAAPAAQDMTSRRVKTKAGVGEEQKRKNRTKARARSKVEWPFASSSTSSALPSALSRVEGEPRMAVRGLRRSQHLPAPPEVGKGQLTDRPAGGVVCSLGPDRATGGRTQRLETMKSTAFERIEQDKSQVAS